MTRVFILWDHSYSVGNLTLDTQHQKFFSIINKLYESYVDQTTAIKVKEIIDDLVDYSDYHFKPEEELFCKYNYPEKEKHIEKHAEFSLKVSKFKDDLLKGNINLSFQLMNFLKDWLLNHIKAEDQEYTGFLKSKELEQ